MCNMISRCVIEAALTVGSAGLEQWESCAHTHLIHRDEKYVWVNRSLQGEQDQPSAAAPLCSSHAPTQHLTHVTFCLSFSLPLPNRPPHLFSFEPCPARSACHVSAVCSAARSITHGCQRSRSTRTLENLDSPWPHQSSLPGCELAL